MNMLISCVVLASTMAVLGAMHMAYEGLKCIIGKLDKSSRSYYDYVDNRR